jgi:predicted amidohydrolase
MIYILALQSIVRWEAMSVRIGIAQMVSGENKVKNLKVAKGMVISAAEKGAELVLLPELFGYLPPTINRKGYLQNAENINGQTLTMLSKIAREGGLAIIAGSIIEKSKYELFNTSCLVAPDGKLFSYRKVHLFKFKGINESSIFSEGAEPSVAEFLGKKIGLTICFDLRFPEIYRAEMLMGAEMISNVAAFLEKTGKAHWMTLLRARAIENQVFVLAANQAKGEGEGPVYFGNSCVIGPWGELVAKAGQQEELLIADVDLRKVREVRRELPCLNARRPEAYIINKIKK